MKQLRLRHFVNTHHRDFKFLGGRLSVGSVLYVRNYTVRERFELMSRPSKRQDLQRFSIELNLNKKNPVAEYRILDYSRLPRTIQLPGVEFDFFSRQDCRFVGTGNCLCGSPLTCLKTLYVLT